MRKDACSWLQYPPFFCCRTRVCVLADDILSELKRPYSPDAVTSLRQKAAGAGGIPAVPSDFPIVVDHSSPTARPF